MHNLIMNDFFAMLKLRIKKIMVNPFFIIKNIRIPFFKLYNLIIFIFYFI